MQFDDKLCQCVLTAAYKTFDAPSSIDLGTLGITVADLEASEAAGYGLSFLSGFCATAPDHRPIIRYGMESGHYMVYFGN